MILSQHRGAAASIGALALIWAAAALAGPLEGQWGGVAENGDTAQVTVTNDAVIGFFWDGDYADADGSRMTQRGRQLDFSFAKGKATLKSTPHGARILIRERGKPDVGVDLTKG